MAEDDVTYKKYVPSKLLFGRPHPDPVVENSSLASAESPDITYNLAMPADIIYKGLLSNIQLEAVVYGCQRHLADLPVEKEGSDNNSSNIDNDNQKNENSNEIDSPSYKRIKTDVDEPPMTCATVVESGLSLTKQEVKIKADETGTNNYHFNDLTKRNSKIESDIELTEIGNPQNHYSTAQKNDHLKKVGNTNNENNNAEKRKRDTHQIPMIAGTKIEKSASSTPIRAGFLLGDGAGMGKGRVLAGFICENVCRGRNKHVWISVSSDLYQDAKRDLNDLGLQLNTHLFGKNKLVQSQEGVVFATYSTLIRSTGNQTRLKQLVDWCGGDQFDGLIMFDECHKAKVKYPEKYDENACFSCCPLLMKSSQSKFIIHSLYSLKYNIYYI